VNAGKPQEAVDLIVDQLPTHPFTRNIDDLWMHNQMDADQLREWIEAL
jgi:hypothetical protein